MANEFDWEDDDFDPDAGRDSNALREARKAFKTVKAQNKELLDRIASFEKNQREASVKSVLTSKGLNPKIAAFIPSDITSEEDVSKWVDEYAEVFGSPAPASEGGSSAASNPELDALNRISQVQSSGQPYSGDPDQLAALIKSASNPEELNKVLFGNVMGPTAI